MLDAISVESAFKCQQRGIREIHKDIHKDCPYYDTDVGSLDKYWTR
jgi:hypothetical protein